MSDGIINAMSVDVEDYFQVSAFEGHVSRSSWERIPTRVQENVERILALFAGHGISATFFTLGWIAERHPQLVRTVVEAGHELASHGYDHVKVTDQTKDQFLQDVTRTKGILEEIAGVRVRGYRAPSYSISDSNLWALDVLQECGYEYSSSIYPIRHDLYGMPDAPRFPFRYRADGLLEIPVSTISAFNYHFPCGGGGYFRLLPYSLSRWAIRRVNQRDRQPTVFYFHPWEIDPAQPRQSGVGLKTAVRHYLNLNVMEKRLQQLLKDFRWARMDEVYLSKTGDLTHAYPVSAGSSESGGFVRVRG